MTWRDPRSSGSRLNDGLRFLKGAINDADDAGDLGAGFAIGLLGGNFPRSFSTPTSRLASRTYTLRRLSRLRCVVG